MKILTTFVSLAVAASLGAPTLASAQTYRETIYDLLGDDRASVYRVSDIGDPVYGALPPFEVLTIVRSIGFQPQSPPILRGRVYIVRAFDDQDIPVRVAVDARSGRVVNVAERVAGRFGQVVEERYGAYPVPPSPVPYGSVYREPEYNGQVYNGPVYRGSDATTYSPAPYSPSVAPRDAAPRPRVASRTLATTPMPRAKPQVATAAKPATPPAATSSTTPVPTAVPATTATSSIVEDTGRRDTSIPAPVASRKATPPAEEMDANPASPQAGAPQPDPSLVPVAPLE